MMSNSRITNKPLRKGSTNAKNLSISKVVANEKGFSILELVIVIAIIAILSAVLIPTFSHLIDKASESKTKQEITNAMKEYTLIDPNANLDDYIVVYYENYDNNTIKVFGYKEKELYIIESEYLLKENTLYVDSKNYMEVSSDSLSNFPDHIRLFKYKKEYDVEYVEYSVTLGSEQDEYITSENKELLEGIYLPGEKVLIRPEKLADGVAIFINEKFTKDLYITDEPYEYEFVMPSYNVEITFQHLYIIENSEVSFSQVYDFTNNLDINNINEIYYIPNQTLYDGLNSDFTRCFYYKNTTTDGINNINRIIRKLTETSYKSCNDVLYETGLPREKYIILADDNIYEFYYDEYIYYNGACYKNESYEALFTDSASEGFTFIRNDMQITEYTQPIYKNGVKQESYIDLRSLVFRESDYGLEELLLPTYDESSVITFTGIYGSEGDYGSFTIVANNIFKKGTSIYNVLSDFSFEEYKKTYTVRLNQEQYGDVYIIFDENSEITYDDLFKYLIIDDEWFIKDVYFFSYSLDNRTSIFNSGNIILDSNKTIYYTYIDIHIKLSVIYPFISDLQIERIKELYVVNDDSDESGMSTCKYIENTDNTKEFLESFINSLKDDWYVASNLSYDPGIYGPDVPEKYIINTDEETYEFVYIISPTYKEKVYMKETPLVQIPDDIWEICYTLVKNDMTSDDYKVRVYKDYPVSDELVEVIDKNTSREEKEIDIRKYVFKEKTLKNTYGSKYIEALFDISTNKFTMFDDKILKYEAKGTHYEIANANDFKTYLDEVVIVITQAENYGNIIPAIKNKKLISKRDSKISKEEVLNEIEIYEYKPTTKYSIKFSGSFKEEDYLIQDENKVILIKANFAHEVTIIDELNEYVTEENMERYSGNQPVYEYSGDIYTLPLIPIKEGYVKVKINGKTVKTLKPSYLVSEELTFELNEDIVITFEKVNTLEELYPNEISYTELYPFISELEVENIVEIIKIETDTTNVLANYRSASIISINDEITKEYASNFLRFFREEKCIKTENIESTNKSKYVIVTKDYAYKIEDVNSFELAGTFYESESLAPFPERAYKDGYVFNKPYCIIDDAPVEKLDMDVVVFDITQIPEKIYGSNSGVKLRYSYGNGWDYVEYVLVNSDKNMTVVNKNSKDYLEIISSYSFESYLPYNMEFEINIYKDVNGIKEKVCKVFYKAGDTFTKENLTNLLEPCGCNSTTIYNYYNVETGEILEELFIDDNSIELVDNIDIFIDNEIL